jgi:oligosaccharide repeat unit polymerase
MTGQMRQHKAGGPLVPILAICAAAAIFFLSSLFGDQHQWARLVLSITLVPLILSISRQAGSAGSNMISLITLLYFCFVLIVPALIQTASGEFPFYQKSYDSNAVLMAAIIVAVNSFAFVIGYSIYRGKGPSRLAKIRGPAPIWALILVIAACVAIVVLGLGVVGWDSFWLVRAEAEAEQARLDLASSALLPIVRIAAVLPFLLILGHLRISRSRWRGWLLPLGAAAALAFLFNNPLNTARFQQMAIIISIIFVIAPLFKPAFKTAFVAIYAVAMTTLFPLLSIISRGNESDQLRNAFVYMATSGDVDGFQSVINVVVMVQQNGITWGLRLISALLVFVPRTVWDDKQLPTGTEAADFVGYGFTNVSSPLPSEFYADFSWFGVIVGALALGYFVSRLDRFLAICISESRFYLVVVCGVLAGYITILLRGSLMGVLAPIAASVGLAFAAAALLERVQTRRLRYVSKGPKG